MQEALASTSRTSATQQVLGPQEYWDMWCLYADQPDMVDISHVSILPDFANADITLLVEAGVVVYLSVFFGAFLMH